MAQPGRGAHNGHGGRRDKSKPAPAVVSRGPRKVRFASTSRPSSAATAKRRGASGVFPRTDQQRRPGSAGASGFRSSVVGRRRRAPPPGAQPVLSAHDMSDETLQQIVDRVDNTNLDVELTTDVVGMMTPIQRQRVFQRPVIGARLRFNEYHKHRLGWSKPLRLTGTAKWDYSTRPVPESDFRTDYMRVFPSHVAKRSSFTRRQKTAEAISSYNDTVAAARIPRREMKKPWNKVTRPATFVSATDGVLGSRRKYGYGTTVAEHDLGKTLDHDEHLCLMLDAGSRCRRIADVEMDHRRETRGTAAIQRKPLSSKFVQDAGRWHGSENVIVTGRRQQRRHRLGQKRRQQRRQRQQRQQQRQQRQQQAPGHVGLAATATPEL